MDVLKIHYRSDEMIIYEFFRPGCGEEHHVWVGHKRQEGDQRWGFKGNKEKPTFTPPSLLRSGHFAPHFKQGDNCWCTYNQEQRSKGEPESGFACQQCHSYIPDGVIRFLGDCSHHLAGQNVPLLPVDKKDIGPDFSSWMQTLGIK